MESLNADAIISSYAMIKILFSLWRGERRGAGSGRFLIRGLDDSVNADCGYICQFALGQFRPVNPPHNNDHGRISRHQQNRHVLIQPT
jgi:hypothetical protein